MGPEQGITQLRHIARGLTHSDARCFPVHRFGIGTSRVRDVLTTQTIALNELKVRRINVDGTLPLVFTLKT